MDYYNFNPDFEDTLAFLSPVAQRNTRLSNRVLLPEFIRAEDVHYMKGPCIINQRNQKPLSRTRDTAEVREIAEQYYTESKRYKPVLSIPKHRPLIKVTVTPNNHISTQTNLRKRRPVARKIQSSSSNHESCFKAKNVFLFVARDTKEKLFEIKATGSEYSTRHHSSVWHSENNDIPVEQNYKKLLSSLNMDKKKKKKGKQDKNKKKEKDCMEEESGASSLMDEMAGAEKRKDSGLRDCMCSPPMESLSPQKSRVRISGKIGLTEDHRYVMKCDATVDGKPVESNFFQVPNKCKNFSIDWKEPEPREIPLVCKPCLNFGQREQNTYTQREQNTYTQREQNTQREKPKVYQRDEMVQCNCEQDLAPASVVYCDRYRPSKGPAYKDISLSFRSVETQYSSPNINAMCITNFDNTKRFSWQDEVVQCDCTQDLIMNTNNIGIDVDFENKNIQNGCQNPVVIISVYPKQDVSDKSYEEENTTKEQRGISLTQQEKPKAKKDGKGDKKKGKRSPSPSPSKGKPDKKKEIEKVEKPKGKGKGKDIGEKNKPAKNNKKGGKKDKPNQKEKKPTGSESPERRPSGTQFGITVGRCAECCKGCAGSDRKGDPDNTQRATQFRTKRMMNWVSAKSDASNVAINIDGENEFYDVLFRQGNITTDLKVRKTHKETQASKQRDHGSLENFLQGSVDYGRKIKDDLPIADNTETVDPTLPRLNVRDSIEISHRREEGKNSSDSMITNTSASTDSLHINLGHKHFRGDKCELPNPAERDKEIRELLGIDLRASPSRHYKAVAAKPEMDCTCSVHCVYRRQRKSDVNKVKNDQELRPWLCMENAKQTNDYIKTNHSAKKNYKYVDCAMECSVCRDVPISSSHESSSAIYGCDSEDERNNRREIFQEVFSISNSDSSSAVPKSLLEFETHKKSTVAFWFHKKESGGKKDYMPRKLLSEQCITMKCLYDEPSVEENDHLNKLPTYAQKERPRRQPKDQQIFENSPNQSCKDLLHEESFDFEMCNQKRRTSACDIENSLEEELTGLPEENSLLCNQLILNRNINIFLQVEQFSKQKPIILTRKQYESVKQVIEKSIKRKTTGISKNQSGGKISLAAEINTKMLDKKTEISNKNTQWTHNTALNKEKKKKNCWDIFKTNTNKSHKPIIYADQGYCASNVTFLSSKNEGLVESLKQSIVSGTQTGLNTTTSSKQCFECVSKLKEPLRNSEKTNTNCLEIREHDYTNETDYAAIDRNLQCNTKKYRECTQTVDSSDLEIEQHEVNNFSGNTKLVRKNVGHKDELKKCIKTTQDLDEHKVNQLAKTKIPISGYTKLVNEDPSYKAESKKYTKTTQDLDKHKINQCEKIKTLEKLQLNNQDVLPFDDDERQQSKKTIMAIKSKLLEYEQKLKLTRDKIEQEVLNTKPKIRATQETERTKDRKSRVEASLKRKVNNNKTTRGTQRDRDSGSIEDHTSQSACCECCYCSDPVVLHENDGGISKLLSPPKVKITEASQIKATYGEKPDCCKHCGKLKELHTCDLCCNTLNGRCTHICYCYNLTGENSKPSIKNIFINDRQYAVSSTEVRYTSVIYTNYNHITFSSENLTSDNIVPPAANLVINNYDSNSLHTIFKGRRKPPTPNLGTSSYSVYSDYSDATSARNQEATKPMQDKKSFLRRLISLFVMRTKVSHEKIYGRKPKEKILSSSVDSYDINTSLCAVDMSSSIYDTSASFYSNHSIQPITSKTSKIIKRGFLTSVRVFLANKRT